MKTFIVTLMLFLLKGWEVHAPPVQSEATESPPGIELIKSLMAISNQNLPNNATEILQQMFEALGSQMEEQMVMIKERMVSMFDMEGAISNQNLPKNATEILQQIIEALDSQVEEQMVMMKDRAIFNQNLPKNVTEILQQIIEALDSQVEEQMVMMKERMVSLFDMEGAIFNQNLPKNATEILQQIIEALDSQVEEQMVMMKDRAIFNQNLPKNATEILQQIIEALGSQVEEQMVMMDRAISNQNIPNNVTEILQQRFEALGSQVEEQMVMMKDRMVSLFEQIHTEDIGLPKRPASSIIEQLEALKTNISQWAVGAVPDNTSSIFPDNVREEFNQKMEQFQQLFIPLISTVQERFKEGVANFRRSVTPGIQEIKKLVTESESAN